MTPEELFRRHELFGSLEPAERQDLLGHLRMKPFGTSTVIFREGDKAEGLYGVLEGQIIVTLDSPDGKALTINSFGPGDFFGEIAFLDGGGRTATAIARQPSRLIYLGRDVFLPFLRRRPDAALRTIAFLCGRLRRTTQLVQDTTFLDIASRLAKQLAALVREECQRQRTADTVTLSVSHQELAQRLGASREIVSRQLAQWRKAGIVELGRGKIVIRDPGFFERMLFPN